MTVMANAVNAMESNFNAWSAGWGGSFGEFFSVYRVGPQTPATGVLDDTPIATGFNARIRRTSSRDVLEDAIFDLVVFEVDCDRSALQFGDVLVDERTSTAYTYVQHRLTREVVWMRTEALATITRPLAAGGRPDQQPAAGSLYQSQYLGPSQDTEWPLILDGGQFHFEQNGFGAYVPIGIQPSARVRDAAKNDAAGMMPSALPVGQFVAYVPVLGDEIIRVNDILNFKSSGERYRIQKLYTSDADGIFGYICVCDHLSSLVRQ